MQQTTLFKYQASTMTDEEFWKHMELLDELSEQAHMMMGGFGIKFQVGSGKQVTVPFVRFRQNFPIIAS